MVTSFLETFFAPQSHSLWIQIADCLLFDYYFGHHYFGEEIHCALEKMVTAHPTKSTGLSHEYSSLVLLGTIPFSLH